jgi:5'-nucleotidase/UDP-sugar diphosphatase
MGLNLSLPILDETGKVLCPPYHKRFAPNPEVNAFLKPYLARTEKLLGQTIGMATEDITLGVRSDRPKSSPLGNLITDAIKEFSGADIAFHNVGGIRDDLVKGQITYHHVQRVLPFANTVILYELTGKQIMEILEIMVSFERDKGFLEISGLVFQIKNGKLSDVALCSPLCPGRVQALRGQKLHAHQVYKVAINSFIASGGDGYSIFKTFQKKTDTGFYLAAILAEYIKKYAPISPDRTPRIRWVE